MRILYLHQHFSTPSGGVGTRSYELARRLIARGHAVTMVCGAYANARTGLEGPFEGNQRRGRVDGIDVIEFAVPYSNRMSFVARVKAFLSYSWKAARVVLQQECDIVFATSTPLTVALPALAGRLLKGRRYIFEVRDVWPELPRAMGVITNPVVLGLMRGLEWAAYKFSSGLVGLSPGICAHLAQESGGAKPLADVPNASDITIFGADGIVPMRPDGIAEDAFLAVFTGTHGLANGLDSILDAAQVLKKRADDGDASAARIVLAFIGYGKEKPRLEERARCEDLENCRFYPPVAKTELARLLAGADAGLMVLKNVSAFHDGTSPNKFFDYIAAGLPVVNNYPGWLAGMIASAGCGVVVAPDDAHAFADALTMLASDPEGCKAMGRAGRKLAETEFDRDLLATRFVEFIEEVAQI